MTAVIGLETSAEQKDPPARPDIAKDAKGPQPRTATFARAELTVYDAKPGGSGKDLGGPRDRLEFQFNPKEFTIAKSATWTSKPARGAQKAGPPEFTGAGPGKLSVEMFFDASGTHDRTVVTAVEKLFACCVPTEESLKDKKASPPLVVLKWGTTRSFPAYVTSVSAKYTLFDSDGTPIRATCSVSMEEMPGVTAKQNPTSGAVAARRLHTVVAGDTLASVAFRQYGDPAMWRPLAAFNGIDDPLRVRPGATLLVPALEELGRGGG
ncbi:LysM peptidoglycan-binding domain-containing protein [Blastococcus sp. CT_GayMR19]|uniref:CIS tube protein n=1 Tax=Blastococcus sp. CT_GayMR19 TaxID=2559608 RepID=UPI0010747CA3|nr:LysM peptidoglycan-binding domain-containing protein [Blastococcus sp. CT_GayMR19]TFV77482.1 LysM peptidoglycan-binding domain-containing protein [Blastococcus sp. CT_GayMR19]